MPPSIPSAKLKCEEIQLLTNYSSPPHNSFWETFPKRDIPVSAQTPVDIDMFEGLIEQVKPKFTIHQILRAKKCISFLRSGAPAFQIKELPPIFCKNVPSTAKHGQLVTDTIAVWIKKGFASGPFESPPLARFRVNPLIAVEQHGKIRPVLNVSDPAGRSFNDNVDRNGVEKVYMSSAKDFGYSLCKAGVSANFSKFDLSDAYKNIPCKSSDFRIQGFFWLGRYFFETQQIFGAISSVGNYDTFGHTVEDVALAISETPAELTHRRLDDIPTVSPVSKSWCEDFSKVYSEICDSINVKLAPDCPNKDKAFRNEKEGKVLGIIFRSSDLSWTYPAEKRLKCLNAIAKLLAGENVDLLFMQKLLGRLSDICQMCPFMRCFKRQIIDFMMYLQSNTDILAPAPESTRSDLLVWAGMLSLSEWLPVPREPCGPPLRYKLFTADAAGVADGKVNDGAGVGGVGLDEDGVIISCFQVLWDDDMINFKKDSKGARFGSKTSTLEMVGIVLPFLLCPNFLHNQHVVFSTDNIGCYFGWLNMSVSGDITASILVKAVLLMSSFLGTTVHVLHVPRKSSWENIVADKLSREKSTDYAVKRLLNSFGPTVVPEFFSEWLKDPVEDWSLPMKCLEYVISIV